MATLKKIALKTGANQLGQPSALTQWGGVVTDVPAPGGLAAFDDMVNFLCRKGRIQLRPKLNSWGTPPDGANVQVMITFLDAVNSYHTLVLTTQNAYMVTAGPVWHLLTYPVGITNLSGTALPYGIITILNRVYFSNGSVPLLFADGESSLKVAGDVPGSALFITQNTDTLIMAATTEPAPGVINSTFFPNRVRWSAGGLPDEYDNTVDFSAGFNDLVEVPDVITGLTTLGLNTFVFRTNGITVMYPTGTSGLGVLPFNFQDFSFAPLGIGNAYPYSLATYGPRCVFVAEDDIYMFDGTTPQPIGFGNKKAIYKDLSLATGTVVGTILPVLGPNYDFLAYYLSIPGPNSTWVFGWDEKTWMRISSSVGSLTASNFVSVGV
jgi:hypothetical protein